MELSRGGKEDCDDSLSAPASFDRKPQSKMQAASPELPSGSHVRGLLVRFCNPTLISSELLMKWIVSSWPE